MSDPKIKLFGKTIELPEVSEAAEICEPAQTCHENSSNQKLACSSNCSVLEDSSFIGDDDVGDHKSQQSQSGPKQDDADDENQSHPAPPKELKDSNSSPPQADNSKQVPSDSNNSQDKTLKKPDKILPCPRCNSMDTKFCYFNNYNMNQPRHFCKNCQRYWTAGGTMRNVPVGAGRRKNKTSQFRPLASNPDGSLLGFNSEVPLCESMVSVLNIRSKENGDDRLSESLILSSKDEAGKKKNGFREFMPNCRHPFPSQVPIFRGAHWAYPIPMPFYSTMPHYWVGPGGVWKVPFVTPPTPAPSSDPNFPTLGKHSRDENILEPAHSEKCLWVPKTLRIDDPGGAAKSSIWSTTLGINNDRDDDDSVVGVGVGVGGGLFKAFQSQSKDDEKSPIQETSTVLQANPAALSRSVSFHESS